MRADNAPQLLTYVAVSWGDFSPHPELVRAAHPVHKDQWRELFARHQDYEARLAAWTVEAGHLTDPWTADLASSLDTGQQPSNNDRRPLPRDPGEVYEAVLGAAWERLASEREWRRDDLQLLLTQVLRAGAAAYAELPPIAQPWIGSGRSETPAGQWLKARAAAADRCRAGLAWTEATCGVAIFRPDSCHVRGCPRCESARSSRLVERFMAAAAGCGPRCIEPRHLKGSHLRPMRQAKLHTFTIPNVPRDQVGPAAKVLKAAHRRLRQRAIYRGGECRTAGWKAEHHAWLLGCEPDCAVAHPGGEHHDRGHGRRGCLMQPPGSRVPCPGGRLHRRCGRFRHSPVLGGVYAVETTYNERSATWNVHLHVLAEAPYIAQAELAATWTAVVPPEWRRGHDGLVVDVRPVRCKRHGGSCRCPDGMRDALKEVLKYVGKPSQGDRPEAQERDRLKGAGILDPEDPERFVQLLLAWHGARLASGFGAWAVLPKEPDDRPESVFVGDHQNPFAGWKLPRYCPHCGHEARWSQPIVASRLEAFRWLRDDGGGPAPPLSWMPYYASRTWH